MNVACRVPLGSLRSFLAAADGMEDFPPSPSRTSLSSRHLRCAAAKSNLYTISTDVIKLLYRSVRSLNENTNDIDAIFGVGNEKRDSEVKRAECICYPDISRRVNGRIRVMIGTARHVHRLPTTKSL